MALIAAMLTMCHLNGMEPAWQENQMDIETQAPDIPPAMIQVFMLLTELKGQHLLPHELVHLIQMAYVDLHADVIMEVLRDLNKNLNNPQKLLESIGRSLVLCDSHLVIVVLKKCLCDAGKLLCDIKDRDEETVLHRVCQKNYLYPDQSYVNIILHVACDFGEVGRLIFMKDTRGCSALHHAMLWQRTECINALLTQSSKLGKAWELIKEEDNWNDTALHHTTTCCAFVVQALHYAPNDEEAWNLIQAENRCCYTALHHAACMGHVDFVNALIQAADKLGKKSVLIFKQSNERKGETALHRAVHNRHTAVIRTLLEAVSPMAWTLILLEYEGRTALDWAIANNHADVIDILESYRPNQL